VTTSPLRRRRLGAAAALKVLRGWAQTRSAPPDAPVLLMRLGASGLGLHRL